MRTSIRIAASCLLLFAGGVIAAPPPGGNYLQTCTDAVVGPDNVLRAKCRSVVDSSLALPCSGAIENVNGKLTCVGPAAAPKTGTGTAAPTKAPIIPMKPSAGLDSNLVAVLQQWHGALETWHGSHFLVAPPATTPAALKAVLVQWHKALETWHGPHFLLDPAKLAESPSNKDLVALLQQWHGALEAWKGTHFLVRISLLPDGTVGKS